MSKPEPQSFRTAAAIAEQWKRDHPEAEAEGQAYAPDCPIIPFGAGLDAGAQDHQAVSEPERPTSNPAVPLAIERIYRDALGDIEGNLNEPVVLAAIANLDVIDRYNMLLLLGQQTRFFFNLYQSETLSPIPNALHIAIFGVACGFTCMAAEIIQKTIPGCTPELADANEKQAKAFIFRVKQILLGKVRGELILPPGCQGGPPKGN